MCVASFDMAYRLDLFSHLCVCGCMQECVGACCMLKCTHLHIHNAFWISEWTLWSVTYLEAFVLRKLVLQTLIKMKCSITKLLDLDSAW